jgi:RNA polymerase sigma-32 factor
MGYPIATASFDQFLKQVRQIKLLSPEREYELAVKYKETQDSEAAHELVVSHLPFVVKTAFRFRNYMLPVQDLVQEGAIGLMKALKRFDPYRGYRLVSFAVWWIKAYIKNHILKTWSLVKMGTTQAQRKLFYRMGDIGEHPDEESRSQRIQELAADLKVKEGEVIEMEARMKAREWSLDQALAEDKSLTGIDVLEDRSPSQETLLMEKQTQAALSGFTNKALKKLDARERFIISKRFLEESPWTLQKLGDHFGTSRERVRQLEVRALGKLRKELEPQAAAGLLPA